MVRARGPLDSENQKIDETKKPYDEFSWEEKHLHKTVRVKKKGNGRTERGEQGCAFAGQRENS